jgi:hypothetical protein
MMQAWSNYCAGQSADVIDLSAKRQRLTYPRFKLGTQVVAGGAKPPVFARHHASPA